MNDREKLEFKSELQSLINNFAYDQGLYGLKFTYDGYHVCDYRPDDCYCSVESELVIEEIG